MWLNLNNSLRCLWKKKEKKKQTNTILEKQYSGSERGKLSCRKTATWLFKSSFVPAVYTLPEATSPWVSDISVGDFFETLWYWMENKLQFLYFHISLPLARKEGHKPYCPLQNKQHIGLLFSKHLHSLQVVSLLKPYFGKKQIHIFSTDTNILFHFLNFSCTKKCLLFNSIQI